MVKLRPLVLNALVTGDFAQLGDALASNTYPESLGVLTDPEVVSELARLLDDSDPTNWMTRPTTWDSTVYGPILRLKPAEELLHLLWQDLDTRLSRKMAAVSRTVHLRSRGAVLCFFGRAELCLIVQYTRSTGPAVRLRPVAAFANPTAVLDLVKFFCQASAEIRNTIKTIALSVDKLIFVRGSLVHVDRQRDNVFGPSIDTVLMAELIVEWLASSTSDSMSALEIGSGSGLLSVIMASCDRDRVRELTALDISPFAARCTLKNLHINDRPLDSSLQTVRVRAERFSAPQFVDRFDLVVCNPPYLPKTEEAGFSSMRELERAAGGEGGLDLCLEILSSLSSLLSDDGACLLMTSSVTEQEVQRNIPAELKSSPALHGVGIRVPLDVDAVWEHPAWRKKLLEQGLIEQDESGGLWHHVRPLWITRRK